MVDKAVMEVICDGCHKSICISFGDKSYHLECFRKSKLTISPCKCGHVPSLDEVKFTKEQLDG